MASPSHIELMLAERREKVKKAAPSSAEAVKEKKNKFAKSLHARTRLTRNKLTRKAAAIQRVKAKSAATRVAKKIKAKKAVQEVRKKVAEKKAQKA